MEGDEGLVVDRDIDGAQAAGREPAEVGRFKCPAAQLAVRRAASGAGAGYHIYVASKKGPAVVLRFSAPAVSASPAARASAEDLAAMMLSTIQGVEFGSDTTWDQKEEIWKLSGKIVRAANITQSAIGSEGVWTTTVAAAVFIF